MTYNTMSRLGVAALLALLPVCAVQAQPASEFSDVGRRTETGDTLQVRHIDGRLTTGDLRAVSADGLVLEVGGRLVTVPLAEMREVGTTSDGLRNGALIGLGAGAVLGMFHAASSVSDGSLAGAAAAGPAALIGLVGGAAAGVGIGIGVDALVRRYRILYRAPVQLTPTAVAGAGYGIAFRVSW